MTDAPERINAWRYNGEQCRGGWITADVGYADAEYTRSDLIPAMLAKARAEGREEGIREAVKECEGWGEGRMAQLILALLDQPAPAKRKED